MTLMDLAFDDVPISVIRADHKAVDRVGVEGTQTVTCVVKIHDNRVAILFP